MKNGNYQVNLKFLRESFVIFLYSQLLRSQLYNALTVLVRNKSAAHCWGIMSLHRLEGATCQQVLGSEVTVIKLD